MFISLVLLHVFLPFISCQSSFNEVDGNVPHYREVPSTSFSCEEQQFAGYYSDPEAECQVFHICVRRENRFEQFSFLCPNETVFHQQLLVCVWWDMFDCSSAPTLYYINEAIFEDSGNERLESQIARSQGKSLDAVAENINPEGREFSSGGPEISNTGKFLQKTSSEGQSKSRTTAEPPIVIKDSFSDREGVKPKAPKPSIKSVFTTDIPHTTEAKFKERITSTFNLSNPSTKVPNIIKRVDTDAKSGFRSSGINKVPAKEVNKSKKLISKKVSDKNVSTTNNLQPKPTSSLASPSSFRNKNLRQKSRTRTWTTTERSTTASPRRLSTSAFRTRTTPSPQRKASSQRASTKSTFRENIHTFTKEPQVKPTKKVTPLQRNLQKTTENISSTKRVSPLPRSRQSLSIKTTTPVTIEKVTSAPKIFEPQKTVQGFKKAVRKPSVFNNSNRSAFETKKTNLNKPLLTSTNIKLPSQRTRSDKVSLPVRVEPTKPTQKLVKQKDHRRVDAPRLSTTFPQSTRESNTFGKSIANDSKVVPTQSISTKPLGKQRNKFKVTKKQPIKQIKQSTKQIIPITPTPRTQNTGKQVRTFRPRVQSVNKSTFRQPQSTRASRIRPKPTFRKNLSNGLTAYDILQDLIRNVTIIRSQALLNSNAGRRGNIRRNRKADIPEMKNEEGFSTHLPVEHENKKIKANRRSDVISPSSLGYLPSEEDLSKNKKLMNCLYNFDNNEFSDCGFVPPASEILKKVGANDLFSFNDFNIPTPASYTRKETSNLNKKGYLSSTKSSFKQNIPSRRSYLNSETPTSSKVKSSTGHIFTKPNLSRTTPNLFVLGAPSIPEDSGKQELKQILLPPPLKSFTSSEETDDDSLLIIERADAENNPQNLKNVYLNTIKSKTKTNDSKNKILPSLSLDLPDTSSSPRRPFPTPLGMQYDSKQEEWSWSNQTKQSNQDLLATKSPQRNSVKLQESIFASFGESLQGQNESGYLQGSPTPPNGLY